jgi:hypothetical protein
MKKIFFLSLFICFSTCLFSQDIIITKDDKILEVKVVKVYDAVIKYVLFNEPDGETFLILKSKIISLTYENGKVEYFGEVNKNSVQPNTVEKNPNIFSNPEKIRKNVIRFKPLVTIFGVFSGGFEFELQYSRYLTKGFAIPVDIGIASYGGVLGFMLLTGVEGVPLQHRQKSGLFLNALAGFMVLNNYPYQAIGFLANPNVGYQLMTKKGFVFNAAIGPEYNGITNKFRARFHLDFGFAF